MLSYEITANPSFKAPPTLSGTFSVGTSGDGRSLDLALPDGMYKLAVTFEGKRGAPKHKVFKVDCDPQPTTPPVEPTDQAVPEPTLEPTIEPTEEPTTQVTDPTNGPEPEVAGVNRPPRSDTGATPTGAVKTGGGGTAHADDAPPLALGLGVVLLALGSIGVRPWRKRG